VRKRNLLPWLIAILCGLVGLSLLVIALLPYGAMKALLDPLSRDGTLSMLRPDDAIAFRFLIGTASACIFGFSYLTGKRRWKSVIGFFKRLWGDCHSFFSITAELKAEVGFLAALLVITAFAVIHRLAFIENPMLHDESYTVVTFADTIFHAMTDYSLPNNHIFHTILVNLSVRAFGLAPWTVRLPAFLAGALLVPGVYCLARRIYDPWTGLVAGILVAFSPSLGSYSTNARGYTLVALFALLILILGNYVRRERNLLAWGLIGVFSALGLYTVPVMLFPFGILFAWLFLENLAASPAPYSSRWDFLRYWLIAGLLAAFLTLILYTPVLIYTGPQKLFANGFVAPLPWGDLADTWRARLTDTWTEWTGSVPLAVILVLAAGWVLGLIFHRKLSTNRVPLQLAAILAIAILLFVQRPNPWAKVWVFLLPLMLMWAAAGIVGLLRNVRLKFMGNFSLAGVVTVVVLLAGAWSTVRIMPKLPVLLAQRGDVENVVLFLRDHISDTDLIVVDSPDDAPAWFYALEYDIPNIHFDKRIPYTQAWILVDPPDGQTVESVLADRGPDIPALDLASIRLIQEVGARQIFECPIK
jgi:hypothetical protein